MSYFAERYGYRVGDFPISEWIGNCTISLPFYPDMPLEMSTLLRRRSSAASIRPAQRHGVPSRARRA
jgi:hypothetical protein